MSTPHPPNTFFDPAAGCYKPIRANPHPEESPAARMKRKRIRERLNALSDQQLFNERCRDPWDA